MSDVICRMTDVRPECEKLQMAITQQRVTRCPSCLVLRWGFRGRRIERLRAISGWIKSKMAADGHFENFKWPMDQMDRLRVWF